MDATAAAAIWLALLLRLCVEGGGHQPEPRESNAIVEKTPAIDHEHRLLFECQHTDYRTYIKCLKREKRQHYDHRDGNSENRRSCLDECLEKNCTSHACTRDCYAHCRRRIIETSSRTVETLYECENRDCSSKVPNITTNIHIHNVPPNSTAQPHCCNPTSTAAQPSTDGPCTAPNTTCADNGKININNVINNNFAQQPAVPPACPCPGCYCYQWQPELTIGIRLGGGPFGGNCLYGPWPCFQTNSNPADCSMCNNPFLRYQCSVNCVPVQSSNSTVASSRHGMTPLNRPITEGSYRSNNGYYNNNGGKNTIDY